MKIRKFLIQSIFVVLAFIFSAGVVLADNYNDARLFFTDSKYSADAKTSVSATLKSISSYAYFYIEDNYWKSIGDTTKQNDYIKTLDKLGIEFDTNIYPNLTKFYGKPWEPGIDNDTRITFLVMPLKENFGGYFSSKDEYDQKTFSDSNQREMVYISAADISIRDFNILKTFIAHEFTHLIIFYQKEKLKNISEDVWFHEARAEYSSTVLSYDSVFAGSNLERRVDNFEENFSDPIGEWKNQAADYGLVMTFMQYLKDNYEINKILVDTLQGDKAGIGSINDIFTAGGSSEEFEDVFMNFAIANYINDKSINDGKYGYGNANLKNIKLSPSFIASISNGGKISQDISLKDWSFKYYKFNGLAKTAKITLKKSLVSDAYKVGIIITNSDGTKTVQKIDLTQKDTELYLSGLGTIIRDFTIVPIAGNKTENFTDNDPSYLLNLSVESVNGIAPVIDSISSNYGFSDGGVPVKILGNYFEQGARLYFGDIEAKISKISTDSIEAIVPAGDLSDVLVKVVNPVGIQSNLATFKYFKRMPEGSLIRAFGDSRVFIVKGDYRRHIKDAKIFSFYGHLGFDKVIDVSWQELGLYKESNLIKSEHSPKVYEVENSTRHWLNMTGDQFMTSGRGWDAIYLINKKEFDFYKNGADIKI